MAAEGHHVVRPDALNVSRPSRPRSWESEFAGAMHDDLVDAVEWAVTDGHADPARVAILGDSYGGYAAPGSPPSPTSTASPLP